MDIKQNFSQINDSVGIVQIEYYTYPDKITLESGIEFGPITIAYETYGKLNDAGDNAILLLHALSGDSHAAGYYTKEDKKPGWWDSMVGPNKAFDTNKFFIVCSNILGGCKGTTGPSSINPETQKPYALDFPVITVEDMVKTQKLLVDYLGIKSILSVAGGSMGGMQAMEWVINYPEFVKSAIVIASTSRLTAQGIAFNAVGRTAIISDPKWNNGNYYTSEPPANGLSIARMIGHITYLSEESMHSKFGRKLQDKTAPDFNFDTDFQVESYLQHQGQSFVDRFDANSYLYITKAMDYYDVPSKYGSLAVAFGKSKAKFLIVSFSSDWLFPPEQSKDIVKALMNSDKDVAYCAIESKFGHDAFLLEQDHQTRIINSFLKDIFKGNNS
jgi:homoserine O-acetyltransferase